MCKGCLDSALPASAIHAKKYALTIRLTHLQVDTFPAGPALSAGVSPADWLSLPQRPEETTHDEAHEGGVPQTGTQGDTPNSPVSGPSTPPQAPRSGRTDQSRVETDDKLGKTVCYINVAISCV